MASMASLVIANSLFIFLVTTSTTMLLEPVVQRNSISNQFKAQLLKKFFCTKRDWWLLCLQIFIVPIGALILLAFPIRFSSNDSLPPLEMTLNTYQESLSFVSKSNTTTPLQLEYQRLFSDSQKLDVIDEDMDQHILRKFNYSVLEYNSKLLVGASFTNESCIGWFNARVFHSAPLALNLIYNAIIRTACPSCSLAVVNNPLPRAHEDGGKSSSNSILPVLINVVLAIVCIMSYVPSSYVSFYIRERTSRVKLLQIICGVRAEFYWLTNLLWDFIALQLCCFVVLIVLIAQKLEGFAGVQQIGTLILILFVFSISILPLIYLLSFWIKNPTFGFVKVLALFGTVAIVLLLLQTLSTYIHEETLREILDYGFLLIPTVALGTALIKFSNYLWILVTSEKACNEMPDCTSASICLFQPEYCSAFSNLISFSNTGILLEFIAMVATGTISIVLIWCIERKIFHRLRSKLRQRLTRKNQQEARPTIDADVLLEKNRVSRMSPSDIENRRVVFRNLTKNYGSLCAVKWLSLSTNHSECFGLLGVNGAGKTTAFRMLTGDESISFGNAWINGVSVKTNISQAYRHVGYCPQFDGLLEELTGRETLQIFALLRGIASSEAISLAEELGLENYLDKRIHDYSGGMKRRLSTVLALIGNSSVIFLDEPSSGMDPGAKRKLWDVINRLRDAGKTIVLTTHSMDECEALCTRLAIMVNGEFKCLGPIQHLKSKFSGGFLLYIKLVNVQDSSNLENTVSTVKTFIAEKFDNAELKEDNQTTLSYHIPKSDLSWSAMFAIMEASKKALSIEEYSLGQTTLEQLFLYFSQVDV